jgi:hypothetical protein
VLDSEKQSRLLKGGLPLKAGRLTAGPGVVCPQEARHHDSHDEVALHTKNILPCRSGRERVRSDASVSAREQARLSILWRFNDFTLDCKVP